MKFRLIYQGQLLSDKKGGGFLDARAKHKHEIRKTIHPQLKRLWEISPSLFLEPEPSIRPGTVEWGKPKYDQTAVGLSENYDRCGYKFVPLINRGNHSICSVDVLYLRSAAPGSLFSSGDIDNRLKTLFDGLTMPRDRSQLGGYNEPCDNEKPFFVLLEDDSLITRASVENDTLLQPIDGILDDNAARVIISVSTGVTQVTPMNIHLS